MQLYTNLKIFHYQDKLDSLPQESNTIEAPIHIRIKPTNACNHNCSYCAYLNKDLQLGQDMSIADRIPAQKMEEIVSDCIEMGVKAVTFSGGGEPLCYPQLATTARNLAEGGVSIATLTNGALLHGEVAEVFSSLGTWIRISMDGWDGPSYARFRSVGGDEFSKIMTNIKNFKKLNGKCFLGVSYVINRDNADHVFEMGQKLKDAGVDSIKFSGCVVSNDGHENNRYHAPVFGRIKEQTQRAKAELQSDGFEVFDAYHELDEKFDKQYTWCPNLQIQPVIAADQRVYTCHDKAYNLDAGVLGSIKDQSFKDFWFSNQDKFYEINPIRHCQHHCVANRTNKLIHEYLNVNPDHLPFV
ncbi:radical SAM protein [Maridesulfovibrio salexigens]|uniref:Radical SAM domain protein n=1 Tax=Maridesulfovibrio salexigens (strain ATCC 14822 / DSM 2638 / NCIMB 8403 / VKM B-1763) TaxID=526222 RepID=C6BXR3_MARSD|nr:radical SAM protein [Maridesulfovibrio salexigens]ACS78621.1 Radical SAM domain protein [Maridesulfovibrio salexigens DSM 2638]